MIKSRRTFFLGVFIFVIPFLGFSSWWKTFFVCLSGLLLISFSISLALPKKIKRPRKKDKVTPVFMENSPLIKEEKAEIRTDASSIQSDTNQPHPLQ